MANAVRPPNEQALAIDLEGVHGTEAEGHPVAIAQDPHDRGAACIAKLALI